MKKNRCSHANHVSLGDYVVAQRSERVNGEKSLAKFQGGMVRTGTAGEPRREIVQQREALVCSGMSCPIIQPNGESNGQMCDRQLSELGCAVSWPC